VPTAAFPNRPEETLALVRVPEKEDDPREELPKWELSIFESARLDEIADEPRELAESEFPPRAPDEFEVTPGVKLDPRELPALMAGEELRPAPVAPFTPPRTELFALEPPPARPK
jgi:hypothetical protein